MPDRKISAISHTSDYQASRLLVAAHDIDVDNEAWRVGSIGGLSYRTTTATTTLTASDRASLIDCTSGNVALHLGNATTLGVGWWCNVVNSSTGTDGRTLTLTASGDTLNGATTDLIAGPNSIFKVIATTATGFRTQGDIVYDSGNQTITPSSLLTLTHNLGTIPRWFWSVLVCLTAELGYVAGDVAGMDFYDSSTARGCTVTADATSLYVAFGTNNPNFIMKHKTTFANSNITNANWAIRVRAYR